MQDQQSRMVQHEKTKQLATKAVKFWKQHKWLLAISKELTELTIELNTSAINLSFNKLLKVVS